jgi:diguanylate cyclase (GGDEF)-like protein
MDFEIDGILKYLKRSVYLFFLILIGISFFFLFVVNKSYQGLNDYSSSVSEKIYQSIYLAEVDSLRTVVLDYSYWTDAVQAISNGLDEAFLSDNYGEYFSEAFSVDGVAIYSPQGTLVATTTKGQVDMPPNTTYEQPIFKALFERAIQTDYAAPSPVTIVAKLNEQPHLVAASVFTPSSYTAEFPKPELYGVLLVTRPIGHALLQDWQNKYNLYDLKIVDANQYIAEDYISAPLHDIDGQVIYNMIWKPDLPGSRFIKELVPTTVTIIFVMIFVFIFFGFQINNYIRLTLHAANELELHKDELHNLAHYDTITHLPNRLLGMDRLTQALKASVRNETLTAVLFIDLDHFKPVNDTYGHEVGDKLLTEIGKRFNSCIRSGIDTVSRLGGDEFIIILANINRHEDVLTVAEKIVTTLAQEVVIDGIRIHVTGSVGVAITDDSTLLPLDMIKLADTAMYKAKESGKNRYSVSEE